MTGPAAYPDPNALAAEFVTMSELLNAGGTGDAVLQRLVDLAVSSLPGCTSASVSTWSARLQYLILASSDDTSTMVNELQHELGTGPCLTAASLSEVIHLPDLSRDQRFPEFSSAVISKTPVRGMVSFHVARQPVASALSFFSTEHGAFEGDALDMAALFAAHARVLFAQAAATERAENLEKALLASRQIGAAMGILMALRQIPEEQAFQLLRQSSQTLNRKLRDVAMEVTQTGAIPLPPQPPPA